MMFTFCEIKTAGFSTFLTRLLFSNLIGRPFSGTGLFCFRSLFLRIVFYLFLFIHVHQPNTH